MGRFASMLAAAFQALSAALKGSWVLVRELGKSVLRWVPGAPEPLPPMPTPAAEPAAEDVAAGLKRWAAERLDGQRTRLPVGIKPAEAAWVARLLGDELTAVAKASPSAIAAHLDGRQRLDKVRPVLNLVADGSEDRAAAKEARKQEMAAALARSAASDARRRAKWAEMDETSDVAPRLAI